MAKKTTKDGRSWGRPAFDRKPILMDLVACELRPQQIAEKHNCSVRTVYVVAEEVGIDMHRRANLLRLQADNDKVFERIEDIVRQYKKTRQFIKIQKHVWMKMANGENRKEA
jgi:hypothetical protein